MIAFGAPLIGFMALLGYLFWATLAIPTARIARHVGYPRWIAWLLWCPWLSAGPTLLARAVIGPGFERSPAHVLGAAIFFFWLPGAAYLWLLAFKLKVASSPPEPTVSPP